MNAQQIAIESLSMDLKRVAVGLQRKSFAMANRFKQEAIERKNEIRRQGIDDDHLEKLISGLEKALANTDERVGEDALMYSTLFQNFAQKRYQEN